MNPTTPQSTPAAGSEHLDRAVIPLDGLDLAPKSKFWAEVDDEIQKELATLEAEARRKFAAVQVQSGRTMGTALLLCSYRTFSTAGSPDDPVVAAVTFIAAQAGITVEADVSGEHSGDTIAMGSSNTVARSKEDVLAEARLAARTLRGTADWIVAALRDGSRTLP